jgi:hypothetical protein
MKIIVRIRHKAIKLKQNLPISIESCENIEILDAV